jgi:hypothetical protein
MLLVLYIYVKILNCEINQTREEKPIYTAMYITTRFDWHIHILNVFKRHVYDKYSKY